MSERPAWRQWEEPADILGRTFVLCFEGPGTDGRYDVRIWEGLRRTKERPYLRAPIRGRDADEARERALEVLHNYVGIDQFRLLAEAVVAPLAPGAKVEIRETAREVIVTLAPPYTFRVPLIIPRGKIFGHDASQAALRTMLDTHLRTQVIRG